MESWLEKYRPNKIIDTEFDNDFKEYLNQLVKMKNLPHMILNGPPGIGKTTLAHCLAKEILEDNYEKFVLELNASDERGLEIIRNRIFEFTQLKDSNEGNSLSKLIILDECDMLTTAAQQALRMIISNSVRCRFIFICNDFSKIIDPIVSRCTIIKLGRVEDENIKKVLNKIIKIENIKATEEGINTLCFIAEGDIRKAIHALQATWITYKLVSPENVYLICDLPDIIEINKIIDKILNHNIAETINLIKLQINKGKNLIDIINLMIKVFELKENINKEKQYEILYQLNILKTKLIEIKSKEFTIVLKYLILISNII